MTPEEKEKTQEFLRKIKEANFSFDTAFMCGTLAFCEENKDRTIELLDKFIELIDKYPDERDFVAEACSAAGVD